MLSDIYLKNFTIVKELHITLHHGLSVLSGETGAGKSIVIGAVNLCLGARADYQLIRHGEKQCEIRLLFDLSQIPKAKSWLESQDLQNDNECVITRVLYSEGRSRSTINGKPCTAMMLRELSEHLIVIHGQHQSQSLLQREAQQAYLDSYGKHEKLLATIQALYQHWRDNDSQLQQLRQLSAEREKQLDFLRYQADELESLNLQQGEWQSLHKEHKQLHQGEQLLENLDQAISGSIEDENSAATRLQKALASLDRIEPKAEAVKTAISLFNTASIHIEEASDELSKYRHQLDVSPERLASIENRLAEIHAMARKHHSTPELLPEITDSLNKKIHELDNSENHIAELEQQQQDLLGQYQQQAKKLTRLRQAAAKKVNQQITDYMQSLGMKGGEFSIHFEKNPQAISATGDEKLTFYVKTNPGQSAQPLSKVVSGGELSRISLALQTIIAQQDNIPTFIFDEIDVGIGGKTAEMVGKLLKDLGKITQVYCITHLAQVAAQGDHHYQVSKSTRNNETCTNIQPLNREQRIQELARMISASKITAETLSHAEALLTD